MMSFAVICAQFNECKVFELPHAAGFTEYRALLTSLICLFLRSENI